MMRIILASKISIATVTSKELFYEGSITIDKEIIEKADLKPGEKVEVLNLNNGARIQTYVIEGERNSGIICLNGPAARFFEVGDKVIILCYRLVDESEVQNHKVRFVKLDEKNRVISTTLR